MDFDKLIAHAGAIAALLEELRREDYLPAPNIDIEPAERKIMISGGTALGLLTSLGAEPTTDWYGASRSQRNIGITINGWTVQTYQHRGES
ncbi:hypothetical protein H8E07_13380 [bacterium]|nr:hypothetical protein [bacterium]